MCGTATSAFDRGAKNNASTPVPMLLQSSSGRPFDHAQTAGSCTALRCERLDSGMPSERRDQCGRLDAHFERTAPRIFWHGIADFCGRCSRGNSGARERAEQRADAVRCLERCGSSLSHHPLPHDLDRWGRGAGTPDSMLADGACVACAVALPSLSLPPAACPLFSLPLLALALRRMLGSAVTLTCRCMLARITTDQPSAATLAPLPSAPMPSSEGIDASSARIRLRARWNGADGPFDPAMREISDRDATPITPEPTSVPASAPLDSPPPPSAENAASSPSAASPVAASVSSSPAAAASGSSPAAAPASGYFRLRRLPDSRPAAYCNAVRSLFREYFRALGIDMAFQNVETELAELPGWKHQKEGGGLLLLLEHVANSEANAPVYDAAASSAASSSAPSSSASAPAPSETIILAGCVALKDLGDGICEAKRLFVRPSYRGRDFGRLLLVQLMSIAAQVGYKTIRLDTLARFTAANKLYAALGYNRIEAYKSAAKHTDTQNDHAALREERTSIFAPTLAC